MWLVLTLLLPLSLSLSLGYEVVPGCNDWRLDPTSSSRVCCKSCKPGNHMVSECGSDPKSLCKPCVNGTYAPTLTSMYCKICSQCKSPQRLKEPCTASADAVCECVEGFLCGNDACTFCIKQCGKGEEPTEDRGCQTCPAGTFNNQVHHRCVKWRSSCPSPDQRIVARGSAVSDIVCADVNLTTPAPFVKPTAMPSKTDSKDPYAGTALIVAVICACLIVSSAMPLCVALHFKRENAVKMTPVPEEAPAAGRRLVPEPEQCSFCFPQEERGSSSSLLLNDKPFELVV